MTESWQGSTNPEIQSGTAVFRVGDKEVKIPMENFRDFQAFSKLLRAAKKSGRDEAVATMRSTILAALGNVS